jgi:hypothetical protein
MLKKTLYILIALQLLFVSCSKEDRNAQVVSQEEAIDSYISSLTEKTVVRNGGSNRVVIASGADGKVAQVGDSLYFYCSGYSFSSGKGALFFTNDTAVARANNFKTSGLRIETKLGDNSLMPGLRNGLQGVTEKEHCYIIFSSKYGYGNSQVYNVPKMTPLFFDIHIDKIIRNSNDK